MDYNLLWFVLVGVLFSGYAVLDGFDLGVGTLILGIKDDHERRLFYNAIGPVWDGNEVWLVTGGGALFAAFPAVYATVFSGFYLAFILLLFALIFRAVAIEFRSKEPWTWWRRWWDRGFCAGSTTAAMLIGVTMGNIVWGIPLDARGEFAGSLLGLLHPYALLVGVTTVALFMMHGAIYLHLKTEDALQARIRTWINPLIITFIICYALTTLATLLYVPRMTRVLREQPALFALVVLLVLAIANLPREIQRGRDWADPRPLPSSSAKPCDRHFSPTPRASPMPRPSAISCPARRCAACVSTAAAPPWNPCSTTRTACCATPRWHGTANIWRSPGKNPSTMTITTCTNSICQATGSAKSPPARAWRITNRPICLTTT